MCELIGQKLLYQSPIFAVRLPPDSARKERLGECKYSPSQSQIESTFCITPLVAAGAGQSG